MLEELPLRQLGENMRKSRFGDEQMVKILRECDSKPVAEVAKRHGVSEQTLYIWRKKFGTMEVAYAVRRGISSRRACKLVRVARSGLRYESRLKKRDANASACMRELAGQYPRYGYRRVRILAARRGHAMSP